APQDYNAPGHGRGRFPERGTSPQPRRTRRGLPAARLSRGSRFRYPAMCSRPERDRMHFCQWKRRDFITLLGGGAAWPLAARAQQQSGKISRIGLLTRKTDASVSTQIDAFREGLRDLGWVEGRGISIEHRDAEGEFDRLRVLAAELVNLNVDVI